MSDEKKYFVVQFRETGDVSVVPTTWVQNEICLWPPGQKNLRTLIIKRVPPEESWKPFSFKMINSFDDYESALQAEKDAVATTTEDEAGEQRMGKRKIKRKRMPNMYSVPVLSNLQEASNDGEDSEDLVNDVNINSAEIPTNNKNAIGSNHNSVPAPKAKEVCIIQTLTANASDGSTASGSTLSSPPCEIIDVESATVISSDADKFQLLIDIALETKAMMQLVLEAVNASGDSINKKVCLKDDKIREVIPLKTINSFLELDEVLKTDHDTANQLFNKLSLIGGTNYKNLIRRCLPVLFTNELGVLCSWTGQKNNFRVSDTEVIRIFKNAVKTVFPGTTDKEFEVIVAEWLRFSKQRSSRET